MRHLEHTPRVDRPPKSIRLRHRRLLACHSGAAVGPPEGRLAPIGDILFVVAFVDREKARRIISLRRANRREVSHYVKTIKEDQPEDADA